MRTPLFISRDIHLPKNLFGQGLERIGFEGLPRIELDDLDPFAPQIGRPESQGLSKVLEEYEKMDKGGERWMSHRLCLMSLEFSGSS